MQGRSRIPGWLVLLGAMLGAACSHSPPEPAEYVDAQEVTATVAAIDPAARLITLRSEHGQELTLEVHDQVRNLEQVSVGDQVTLGYYSGLAAAVTEAEPADEVGDIELLAGRAEPGERPAGLEGARVSSVVVIESVDTDRNTVSFRGADGLVRVIDVKRPEMQKFIQGLDAGDKVRLTYMEAVAVRVEPAS